MIRTIQRFEGPPQSGKSFLLLSLASGYAKKSLKVAYICPCLEIARYRRSETAIIGVDFLDYRSAVIHESAKLKYDVLLLDDCEEFPLHPHHVGKADPVTLAARMYDTMPERPLVVVGAFGV